MAVYNSGSVRVKVGSAEVKGNNTSFTTYAFFHVRKRIIDFIKKNKLVRAPRDIARNMKHVNETNGYAVPAIIAMCAMVPNWESVKPRSAKNGPNMDPANAPPMMSR